MPWVKPLSLKGNHSRDARLMLGNAPASPAPKRNRNMTRLAKPQAKPVSAVKAIQQRTMRIRTLRGPNLSPSQPLGISNSAYAKENAEKA